MSLNLGKRVREAESLLNSNDVGEPKRFHGEEIDRFLLQLDETLADEEEEEYAPNDELVNGIMRSLEEEIYATCSTSYLNSNSKDNSAASHSFILQESQTLDSYLGFDLSYLLEASDDDLGIPPISSVLDMKHELCPITKETTKGLLDSPYLKSVGENWHYEDKFDNCQELSLYEELQDDMNTYFVSQNMLFDGDFSVAWR